MRILTSLIFPCVLLTLAVAARGPGRVDAYPNADLLVTTEWLAANGPNGERVVFDTRSEQEYIAGHIAGALNLPTAGTFHPKRSGDIGTSEQLGRILGGLGVKKDTHVIVYDGGRSTSAARVFWTLETIGHAKVSVLDGGYPKWVAEKHAVSTEMPQVMPTTYKASEPTSALSTSDTLLEDLENEDCVMLDSRSTGEYEGGRIPNAVHIDWMRNFTSADGKIHVMLAPAALRALYADQGVTRDKRVHAY